MSTLPTGWTIATVGELAEVVQYGSSAKTEAEGGGVPVLRMGNIVDGRLDFTKLKYLPESHTEFPALFLKSGDLLFNRTNSLELVGKSAVYKGEPPVCSFASYLIRLRLSPAYHPDLLAAFLNSTRGRRWAREVATAQVGQANVNGTKLQALKVPVPPQAEQDRIVKEIETQFSRLDAGVQALKRVQVQLKRYRASVLKVACEGRLVATEADLARREQREYEPGDKLLGRILEERRARWESVQLTKMKSAGKAPTDDKWKSKYVEPASPDVSTLAKLPKGWVWATAEQLSEIQGGIQKQPSRAPKANAFPFLRVANVLRGQLNLADVHSIELFKGELERLRLQAGDLLIVEGNGSSSEIGRMAMWNGSIRDCVHQNHLIRLRPIPGVRSGYFSAYWNSPLGASRVLAKASSTTGLFTLSIAKICALPVPLPPEAEQERIVAEVEDRLSITDAAETSLGLNFARAMRMRQAVLFRAFEGRLVSQDSNDEPAAALLERVAQQHSAHAPVRPKGETPMPRPRSSAKKRRPLRAVLAEAEAGLSPDQLLQRAGFGPDSIDDFYEELRVEIGNKEIVELRKNKDTVVLRHHAD